MFIMSNLGWLVIDGGEVKSQEGGIVEGLGIVFGSSDQPDQSPYKDFFTEESYINRKNTFEVPLYYNHGIGLYDEEIGEAVLTKSSQGWDVVAQLDLTNPTAERVYEAVKAKPHGFSTGALSHLVKRVKKENDTNWLKRWNVGEISLTPTPAERNAVVQAVKCMSDNGSAHIYGSEVSVTVSPETDIEKLVASLESALTMLRGFSAKHLGEGFEARLMTKIDEVVKGNVSPKELEGELAEVKTQLEAKEQELAEVKSELLSSEDNLTKANEKIAQLKILAGAKEFIEKNEGK